MVTKRTKGMVQLGLEIPEELNERLRAYCKKRGSKLSDELRLAIRRHLDHPPADVSPGFETPEGRKRARK